jgi:DNA polymerase-3 subunit alpha
MQYIPKYIENRRNPQNIHYRFEELRPILSETYGILTYQEQIMRAVIAVAGYAKSDSDSFRKVISKKKKKELPLHRKWFIHGRKDEDDDGHGHIVKCNPIPGGIKFRGHNEKDLDEMFNEMEDFASYCFNKSHAAVYMAIACATATLLYYYPTEFMAALMTSVKGNQKKIANYIKACQDLNIEILPPDVNMGNDRFVPLPDKKIVYTLSAKFTNDDSLNSLVSLRADEPIKDLKDFFVRGAYTLNKQTIEALVSIGALDSLGIVRSQVIAGLDDIWEKIKKLKDQNKRNEAAWEKYSLYLKQLQSSGCPEQCVLTGKKKCPDCANRKPKRVNRPKDFEFDFDLNDYMPNIQEYPKDVILKLEKKYLGIYMSGHPLHKYSYAIKNMSY